MWSGGTYTKSNAGTGGWTGDAVAGIAIDATRHDTQDNDFAAGINNCLTKDGQNSCTADLNFGGFRPSNVAGGSAAAPAYTANNDTDTGAFSPAANAYAIATGGVERVRVSPTGKVGLGTTAPFATLDVASSLQIGASGTATNNFHITAESTGALQFWNGNYGAGTERMRISSAGNVGIGTTSPGTPLDVVGTATVGNAVTPGFLVNLGRGTGFGRHGYLVGDGTGIELNNQQNGDMLFSTNNAGRLRLTAAGAVNPAGDNAFTLGASGFRWSAVWAANGTIQTSDEREKNTITESVLGLDFVKALRPVSYKWNVGGNTITTETDEDGNTTEIVTPQPGTRTHFGLIAQEVKAAIPDGVDFGGWVLTDKNDPTSQQALRYDQFIAPLIQAVKELTAKVEALEAELAILKGA